MDTRLLLTLLAVCCLCVPALDASATKPKKKADLKEAEELDEARALPHKKSKTKVKVEKGTCPPEFIWKYGKCLFLSGEVTGSWGDALENCRKKGGTLAAIYSDEDNRAVVSSVKEQGGRSHWLGGVFLSKTNQWQWEASGQAFNFTSWLLSDPNPSEESCLLLSKDKFRWNATACTQHHPYICQLLSVQEAKAQLSDDLPSVGPTAPPDDQEYQAPTRRYQGYQARYQDLEKPKRKMKMEAWKRVMAEKWRRRYDGYGVGGGSYYSKMSHMPHRFSPQGWKRGNMYAVDSQYTGGTGVYRGPELIRLRKHRKMGSQVNQFAPANFHPHGEKDGNMHMPILPEDPRWNMADEPYSRRAYRRGMAAWNTPHMFRGKRLSHAPRQYARYGGKRRNTLLGRTADRKDRVKSKYRRYGAGRLVMTKDKRYTQRV